MISRVVKVHTGSKHIPGIAGGNKAGPFLLSRVGGLRILKNKTNTVHVELEKGESGGGGGMHNPTRTSSVIGSGPEPRATPRSRTI